MSIIEKKLSTQVSTNRVSLPKNPPNHRNTSIRSHSITSNTRITNQIQSKSILSSTHALQPVKSPLKHTFYVGKGNNESLIRKIINQRGCWVEIEDSTSTFVNFKWQQDMKGYKYARLVDTGLYRSVLNHFQFHECLCNKEYLFRNLEAYCEKNQQKVWQIVPPTFVLNAKDECNMQYLKQFIQYYIKHFPKQLKDKKSDYQKQANQQKKRLRNYFFNANEKKAMPKMPSMEKCFINHEHGSYLWIMKPTFLNRGRGIQVFSELGDLVSFIQENVVGYIEKSLREEQEQKKFIDYIKRNSDKVRIMGRNQQENKPKRQTYIEREKKELTNSQNTTFDGNQYIRVIPKVPSLIRTDCFLIQKYLERPLLIMNRKFDIRMWVLVTHNLSCFIFRQGYVRLSSQEYSCSEVIDNSVHLTNNAVQKYNSNYGKLVEGNQMSFKDLKIIMQENELNLDTCLTKIYSHVQKSLSATFKKLNPLNRRFVFEVFGYDFMIDEIGYPWLIEVNNNPCIEESSRIVSKLLHRMLDDAFKLTIDVLFPGATYNKKYPVEGYGDNENMWKPLTIKRD